MQLHHSAPVNSIAGNVQAPKESTSLEISIGEMDNQLSRFFNGMNTLDVLAHRLRTPELTPMATDGKVPQASPIPSDHCGKLEYQNGIFNSLNNRLESVIEYLQKTI